MTVISADVIIINKTRFQEHTSIRIKYIQNIVYLKLKEVTYFKKYKHMILNT